MFKKYIILILIIVLGNIMLPSNYLRANFASDMQESDNEFQDISADKWKWIGNNIILEGNVLLNSKNMRIEANKAIINSESHGFETFGESKLITRKFERTLLAPNQLAKLKTNPDLLFELQGVEFNQYGEPKIIVDVYYIADRLSASRILGNIKSGYLTFDNARCITSDMAFNAKRGTRLASGDVELSGAELSTCEYLHEDKSHYSIAATTMELKTHQNNGYDVKNYDFSIGQHSIYASNATFNVYGVPILWLPKFYKPKDESPKLFDFSLGYNSDWGAFVSLSKEIQITDYPSSTVTLLADYYSKRGLGYGTDIDIKTENSKTELFLYGIYDTHPYSPDSILRKLRYDLPNWRYDVRLTNVTHITPTFDFRGHIEFLSDPFFQDHFFNNLYETNPEPASYLALEKQFDYLTTSLYMKLRTNKFFTTAQKLPEFRVDVPRAELFGSNIYYQGNHSINYSVMKWGDYDKASNWGSYTHAKDYSTMRADSVNFLYYPLNLNWINIIPRAGVRFTYYSETSKTKVTDMELQENLMASAITGDFSGDYTNYSSGSGDLRVVGEFGFEANTKIHRTFSDLRSDFFKLDGLRHIMVPYVNYTYITKPNVDRDYIYYFDDIDRIDEQNFFRLGLKNRLQTRSDNRLINTFEMENYWTMFLKEQEGFNHVGDFATKITTSPIKGLVLSTLFSLNVGENNTYGRNGTIRYGEYTDRKGISGTWLNRWNLSVTYEPVEDFIFSFGYYYNDSYATQSAYSMGSTLSDLVSESAFNQYYGLRNQVIKAGLSIPITKDHKTKIAYQIIYDFENGFITDQRVGLIHTLHCWQFALFLAQSKSWDSVGGKDEDLSISFSASLNGISNPVSDARGEVSSLFRMGTGENTKIEN